MAPSILGIRVSLFELAIVPALLLIPFVTWNEVFQLQLRRAVHQSDAKRPGQLSAWVGLVSGVLAMIGTVIGLLSCVAYLMTDVEEFYREFFLYVIFTAPAITLVIKGIPIVIARFLLREEGARQ